MRARLSPREPSLGLIARGAQAKRRRNLFGASGFLVGMHRLVPGHDARCLPFRESSFLHRGEVFRAARSSQGRVGRGEAKP